MMSTSCRWMTAPAMFSEPDEILDAVSGLPVHTVNHNFEVDEFLPRNRAATSATIA